MYFRARLFEAAGLTFVGLDDRCCLNVQLCQWETSPPVGLTGILTSPLYDRRNLHDIGLTN